MLIGAVSQLNILFHILVRTDTTFKVKPNVGHSEGASGITGLIKAVLSLENKKIPPNIKFLNPNPRSKSDVQLFYRGLTLI